MSKSGMLFMAKPTKETNIEEDTIISAGLNSGYFSFRYCRDNLFW